MRPGKTVICSVVFVDVVGYSKVSNAEQLAIKAELNRLLEESLASTAPEDRVVLDTGDGAALCFAGDPEVALFAALSIRSGVARLEAVGAAAVSLAMRMGVNLGPVKVVIDLNNQINVLGDGINVAQRIMAFSEPGQILVSRSFHDAVAPLAAGYRDLFSFEGVRRDKHVREHEIYALALDCEAEMPTPERADGTAGQAAGTQEALPCLEPQLLDVVERKLTQHFGPLAKVIVERAAVRAHDASEFQALLLGSISDGEVRQRVLAEIAPLLGGVANTAAGGSGGISAAPSEPQIAPEELAEAERDLTKIIGPVAHVLVRRAARNAVDRSHFYNDLAGHIPDETRRARFLEGIERD
ncbi:MAG: adenylate/guanylate cyclase domain-containing protein [Rhodospirillales bacterium]|nr:adenylate/guanylate cyclase domain-containing protein [Rhodospirillales bacterium]